LGRAGETIIIAALMAEAVQIVDLRDVSPQQLEPVLEAEQRLWLDELLWDYRPSAQLIRRFLESHSLLGCALFRNGQAAGYGFYVVEDRKALIGGLFATDGHRACDTGSAVLQAMVQRIRKDAKPRRIEAQLIPFGDELDALLLAQRFQLFKRRFMMLSLARAEFRGAPLPPGLRLEPWDDRYFDECARLIPLAYRQHVDSRINDQYRSEKGAQKFLKNIVILPGCGQFYAHGSFVVRPAQGSELKGVVLTSTVSAGVAHVTQICIAPEVQRQGLGTRMMEATARALRAAHFHALTLTVTSSNRPAVALYEQLGFQTLREFTAAVWLAAGGA
jgi:ribosomal protein S18 acetylase RimI-like enzyme